MATARQYGNIPGLGTAPRTIPNPVFDTRRVGPNTKPTPGFPSYDSISSHDSNQGGWKKGGAKDPTEEKEDGELVSNEGQDKEEADKKADTHQQDELTTPTPPIEPSTPSLPTHSQQPEASSSSSVAVMGPPSYASAVKYGKKGTSTLFRDPVGYPPLHTPARRGESSNPQSGGRSNPTVPTTKKKPQPKKKGHRSVRGGPGFTPGQAVPDWNDATIRQRKDGHYIGEHELTDDEDDMYADVPTGNLEAYERTREALLPPSRIPTDYVFDTLRPPVAEANTRVPTEGGGSIREDISSAASDNADTDMLDVVEEGIYESVTRGATDDLSVIAPPDTDGTEKPSDQAGTPPADRDAKRVSNQYLDTMLYYPPPNKFEFHRLATLQLLPNISCRLIPLNRIERKKPERPLPQSCPSFEAWKEMRKSFRVTVDLRAVNVQLDDPEYPFTDIEECLDYLNGATYFAVFDLVDGYNQCPLSLESQELFSVVTRHGVFTPLRVPQGASCSPAYFQSTMENAFRRILRKGLLIYLDDLLVYAKTKAEFLKLIAELLALARQSGLKISASKSDFFSREVTWCGRLISQAEV
eukprot:GHVU01102683.1.p1 GENE.GHVU01102683.1~~GHVU01102683.1.p1  ORF type:complete len:657 (-),score=52.90 GHVU01102683.1:1306-3051(-)